MEVKVTAGLPDRPLISPDELHDAQIMPGSRGAIYAGCRNGEIPAVRLNRRWMIQKAPLLRKLGLETA